MDNNAIEDLTWKEQKLYREAENIHYFDGEDILRKITEGKIKEKNNEEERWRILRANKYELTYRYLMYLKKRWGLPWWRRGWESACQYRGHGFKPRSGKIPHALEQLGPWATIAEPARLEPVLRNKRGHDSERPAHCNEEWPPLATTRESSCTETKTQHSHK